jgi:hypothetical protein
VADQDRESAEGEFEVWYVWGPTDTPVLDFWLPAPNHPRNSRWRSLIDTEAGRTSSLIVPARLSKIPGEMSLAALTNGEPNLAGLFHPQGQVEATGRS